MQQDKYYHRNYRKALKEEKLKEIEDNMEKGVTLSQYPDYIIYNDGRVFSRKSLKFLNPGIKEGYKTLHLIRHYTDGNEKGKSVRLHKLVALAYVNNPCPEDCDRIMFLDGNKLNVNSDNLKWVSNFDHLRDARAKKCGNSKGRRSVNKCDVKTGEVIDTYSSIVNAEKAMGCNRDLIGKACRGDKMDHTALGYLWFYEKDLEVEEFNTQEGEEWRNVVGHGQYMISSFGRIFSKKSKKYLTPSNESGYNKVVLDGKNSRVHKLVANAFLGPPPSDIEKPVVDHKDRNPSNNRVENLQWTSIKQNALYAYTRDNVKNGEKVIKYSLTGEKLGEYDNTTLAAIDMKVNTDTITSACAKESRLENTMTSCGFIWRYANDPLTEEELKSIKFPTVTVKQYTLEGEFVNEYNSIREAAKIAGIHPSCISRACKGEVKSAKGYQWRSDDRPIERIRAGQYKGKVVRMNLDGTYIDEWSSATDAAKALGIQQGHICSVCNGKRKSAGGYKWKRLDDVTETVTNIVEENNTVNEDETETIDCEEEVKSEGVSLPYCPDYVINKDGTVYSNLNSKLIKPNIQGKIPFVAISIIKPNGQKGRKNKKLCKLIAEAYIPNPDNLPYVTHIDGNTMNNVSENLKWISKEELVEKIKKNRVLKFKSVNKYTLDGEFIERYEKISEAAESVNCSTDLMKRICNGKYDHIKFGYVWRYDEKDSKVKFTSEEGEEWKTLKEHPKYKISSFGRFYSNKTGKYMDLSADRLGYIRVKLDGQTYRVHRLIMSIFGEEKPVFMSNPIVTHKDGNNANNRIDNLQWIDNIRTKKQ